MPARFALLPQRMFAERGMRQLNPRNFHAVALKPFPAFVTNRGDHARIAEIIRQFVLVKIPTDAIFARDDFLNRTSHEYDERFRSVDVMADRAKAGTLDHFASPREEPFVKPPQRVSFDSFFRDESAAELLRENARRNRGPAALRAGDEHLSEFARARDGFAQARGSELLDHAVRAHIRPDVRSLSTRGDAWR